MAAAAGKSNEADPARCRRHPRHRHSAGVCPFCLRGRLSRLSAAAARSDANASSPSSSSASSPCSSWEESVAPSAHAPRRRERLGMLLRQEGRESAALAALVVGRREEAPPEEEGERKAKKGNFWARLQQQLHHGAWHRKDGCSLAHSRAAAAEKSAAVPLKRAPAV
ncbi:uncharacterized protein LOC133930643 [Phragmites australis]|uniref:uncharacterized protein LOC133930643 n=1 Tax=Phragmites australis TaxID=29695 RepID=UPI002D7994AE|nr:uncharacterized protein LOC133930643 [Phragmites australis]